MRINEDVANVLGNSRIDGQELFLPEGQLDRKLYVAVNKVLVAIGGKWNRKAKAHVFSEPPQDIVEQILLSGEYTDAKKEFQFFQTPDELARRLVDIACIREGETVLEPSAGRGAIARIVNEELSCDCICDCVELNEDNRKYLTENGFYLVGDDFLECTKRYDVIVGNPPFTKQQDIDHVLHMIELSNRCVVSVMSSSVLFRDNNKTKEFREVVEDLGGTFEMLPEKSFASSGTNVNSCVVHIER